jgi:hypothetical protein
MIRWHADNQRDDTVASGHRVDAARWQEDPEELLGRVEPRQRAGAFVRGLADLPRKHCARIAEHTG